MKFSTILLITLGIFLLILLIVMVPFYLANRGGGSEKIPKAGVFRSNDGGETWTLAARTSEIGVFLPSNILSFVFDPANPDIIYLGTKGSGLWVSKNNGESWARVLDAKGTLAANAEIYDISVSPQDPRIIYLAVFQNSQGHVMKSTDGGITFDDVYFIPVGRFGVFGVAVDPRNANRVSIVTGQGGFLVTQDGGGYWKIEKWFPDGLVKLLPSPGSSDRFYVLTAHGEMYRTDDRGISWLRLTPGYAGYSGAKEITDVKFDPSDVNTLYAASKFGLLRSKDSGVTWQPVSLIIPPAALPVRAVAVNPNYPNELYVGAVSELYKSIDGGERWKVLELPSAAVMRMIHARPQDERIIYIVTQ